MPKASVIAIDGPVGAGKSTIGCLLAVRLGYRFIDTGAMYRGVTWLALEGRLPLEDAEALSHLASTAEIDLTSGGKKVSIAGRDVTRELRQPWVEAAVSQVSKMAGVREALVPRQRDLAQGGMVVMVGRDIGTVVLPQADLKVYLAASAEERARRRHGELLKKGEAVSYNDVLADLKRRDEIDSQRALAPLRPAPDAHIINTDGLTLEEVLAKIVELVGED